MKLHRPYKLEEYNPDWLKEFEKRAEIIKSILGNEVISIEHIGSTSIPGMIAKPQIDIMVVVKDLSKIKDYYKAMEKAGFIPKGNYTGIGEEYFIEDAEDGKRLASIHTLPIGHDEIPNQLNFRNYLRSNEPDRNLYMTVKKDLYQKYSDNYHGYDTGKKDVILEIKSRADKWAKEK